jgi:hypothetical protein
MGLGLRARAETIDTAPADPLAVAGGLGGLATQQPLPGRYVSDAKRGPPSGLVRVFEPDVPQGGECRATM